MARSDVARLATDVEVHATRDAAGALVCVTVYKRGAEEVVRRLRG